MQPLRVTVRNVGSAHGHYRDYALPVWFIDHAIQCMFSRAIVLKRQDFQSANSKHLHATRMILSFHVQAPLGGLPAVHFAADASPLAGSGRDSTGCGSPVAGGSPTTGSSPPAQRGPHGGSAASAAANAASQSAAVDSERSAAGGAAAAQSDTLQQAARQAVSSINAQVRPRCEPCTCLPT